MMLSTSNTALFVLRVLSPVLVLLSTLSIIPARPSLPSSPSPITNVVVATRTPRRALILSFLSLVALTFLLDGLTFVVSAVFHKSWPQHTGIEVNSVLGLAAFAGLAAVGAWKDVYGVEVWLFRRIKASIATALILDLAQVILIGLSIKSYSLSHPASSKPPISLLLHFAFPAFRVLLLFPLVTALLYPHVAYVPILTDNGVEISAPVPTASSLLLPPGSGAHPSTGLSPLAADASKYGTFRSARSTVATSTPTTRATTPAPSPQKTDEKPDITLDPSWREIGRRIGRLSPYLWPSKSRSLQLVAAACIFVLLIGRVVNLALPFTLGEVIRTFEEEETPSPWPYLLAYVALRFLQSGGGLAALRETLWAPVMQYSDREMSQLSFDHILNLSFAWHTRRKTGEILRILDRGAAINHTLELILFSIIPTFIDIIVALIVFAFKFEWTLTLVIFVVMFAYVAVSVVLTKWRTKIRREMNDRDVVTRGIHTDCLLNYETVKYFGGEVHEGERYKNAIRDYQALEYRVIISLNLLNLVQNFIITLGLLIGSMIVALRVTKGQSKPSDFVIFITYLGQLYGPLNGLGYIYRSVNQSLVDTERLLKLLNEPTEVNDKPDAPDLIVDDGVIEFENVSFSYDGRGTALNGVSFKVPKGSSIALVGESGAGKSTILRLLYRFYDLGEGEGRILIDGQDIKDVTQASLRKAIGVVPQDSVLFNSSISYNIGYGKFGASSEDIEEAAKAAQMHDRIMNFPDGYATKVGERGIRLSGGEKQRVAIARTLLKNPPILLLDEATSALDTSTEKDIQKALQNLVRGRSSLSIAHRLSTISSADLILVLKDGQIVEQGSHRELVGLDGIFAAMWADQITATEDPVLPGGEISGKNEISGYLPDEPEDAPVTEDPVVPEAELIDTSDVPPEAPVAEDVPAPIVQEEAETPAVDVAEPEPAPVAFPLSPVVDEPEPLPETDVAFPTSDEAPVSPAPFTFPSSDAAPLTFPTSDDATSQSAPSEATPTPPVTQVTFGTSVNAPPRTGTPDPDAEPKRKRISSQNFQRLARKISITTRRPSSISLIPGLTKKDKDRDSSPRVSVDGGSVRGEGSAPGGSPASSIKDDTDKGKSKKKDKKEKKRKS